MFVALGLSAVIPVTHFGFIFGFYKAYNVGKIGWLILMAFLYILGACIYAARIPERFFPGYCDIWVIYNVCFKRIVLKIYSYDFLIVSKSSDFSCLCRSSCICTLYR